MLSTGKMQKEHTASVYMYVQLFNCICGYIVILYPTLDDGIEAYLVH